MTLLGRDRGQGRPAGRTLHPARVIVGGFGTAVLLGTGLLSLPVATESGRGAGLIDALFTSTSAVCVTGLITVDTSGYWSVFGELVILGLIQAGGLGIMTLATLFALLITRRLGFRTRLVAQAETKTLHTSDVRRVVRNVLLFTLGAEVVAAVVLTVRFATGYGSGFGEAAYSGVFHAISAFNNAGFSLHSDSLMGFVGDPWVILTVAIAAILGGLGFPVVFELARSWRRPRQWSVLTRITVITTAALLTIGTIVFLLAEHANPRTLGDLDGAGPDLLAGFFAAVMPRTAGFNSIDTSALSPESLLANDVLMFIGGGSAGTAGGIKVTTFGLLAFVLWAEMRGEPHTNVGRRQVPVSNQRQALAIVLLGVGLVVAATFTLLALTRHSLDAVLFEAISAFGTVGLSTGITAELPPAGEILVVVLMFVGRLGPLTLASALALRDRRRRYELPEERMIVG